MKMTPTQEAVQTIEILRGALQIAFGKLPVKVCRCNDPDPIPCHVCMMQQAYSSAGHTLNRLNKKRAYKGGKK
jgi:hypothetical protein